MARASDVNLECEKHQTRVCRCLSEPAERKASSKMMIQTSFYTGWIQARGPKIPNALNSAKAYASWHDAALKTYIQPSQLLESKWRHWLCGAALNNGAATCGGRRFSLLWVRRSRDMKKIFNVNVLSALLTLHCMSWQVIVNCTKMVAIVQVHTLQTGFFWQVIWFFRQFFEVTKSASGQMHVFLERYGSMLPSEVLPGGCFKKVVSVFPFDPGFEGFGIMPFSPNSRGWAESKSSFTGILAVCWTSLLTLKFHVDSKCFQEGLPLWKMIGLICRMMLHESGCCMNQDARDPEVRNSFSWLKLATDFRRSKTHWFPEMLAGLK